MTHSEERGPAHPDDTGEHGVVGLFGAAEDPDSQVAASAPRSRGSRHRRRQRRVRRRLVVAISVLALIGLVAVGYVAARAGLDRFKAKDYSGSGTGSVLVHIKQGDTADDIATTLVGDDVVASTRAFLNAAKSSGKSSNFQPGYFRMMKKMSASRAVTRLLDPVNRVFTKLTIPEGQRVAEVLPRLAKATGVSEADLLAASKQLDQLGIPDGYQPKSVEGFLFPQTYEFDPNLSASDVLQQLVSQYTDVDKQLNFDSAAGKVGLKPYQALIIASMVEEEARFDEDKAKVARVILNRFQAGEPLGIDATSIYGALISGKNPKDLTYDEISPYNTRHKPGLPPTAISNPGEASMQAAVNPTPGNWKWYVSKDAAGHLFFTNNYAAFLAASKKCKVEGWGCG